ncbi:circularly permutated Ras protein 1 [Ciona intestinalis]
MDKNKLDEVFIPPIPARATNNIYIQQEDFVQGGDRTAETPQLYPDLEQMIDPSSLSISPPKTPTAPSFSAVNSIRRVEPSAPSPTASMRSRSETAWDAIVEPNQTPSAPEDTYASADTNIVSIKLGIVGQRNNTFFQPAPPTMCSACGAVTVTDSQMVWNCKFCEHENKIVSGNSAPLIPSVSHSDVTYLVQPSATRSQDNNDPMLIFCIDVSGSMCVSSQVKSGNGNVFVTRLQGVQQAIVDQINKIEVTRPNTRIGLVTFSSLVNGIGDGTPEQEIILSDFQLYDFDFIFSTGKTAAIPGPILNTRVQLSKALNSLNTSGGTALGPALLYSVALASQRPGSQVIVCTDGRANMGIGSLETEDDYQMCHHFYDSTTEMALSNGVIVSMMSIVGTDCRLVELGKVASKTAGKVSIVDLENISKTFEDILSESVLATQVSVQLSTHKQLFLANTKETTGSKIEQFVGNITDQSEITFRYGINKEELGPAAPPKVAPFQLRITYRSLTGHQCMRVLTQDRPVTEDRVLAELEMNPAVIGTYAAQSAAALALDGEVDEARVLSLAHKELVGRGMTLRNKAGASVIKTEQIYESVQKQMDNINTTLGKVETESVSSHDSAEETRPYMLDEVYESLPNQPTTSQTDRPPALPPRMYQTGRSKSTTSITNMLSKLPNIPKAIKPKKKKKAAAREYKDDVAQKMFSFSKITSKVFQPAASS